MTRARGRSWAVTLALLLTGGAGCDRGSGVVDLDLRGPDSGLPGIAGGFNAMLPGQTHALIYTGSPSVYWSTQDSSVATVTQQGVVTAHAAGRAVINASVLPPYSYTAFTFIYVYPSECTFSNASDTLAVPSTVPFAIGPSDCGLIFETPHGGDHGSARGWRMTLDSARTVLVDWTPAGSCPELIVTDTMMVTEKRSVTNCYFRPGPWAIELVEGAYVLWVRVGHASASAAFTLSTALATP